MRIKQFLRTFVLHFFIIYALTMIVTFFFVAAEGTAFVKTEYFWQAALFSLAADAPLAVFIGQESLSGKQFWIRVGIHAALLEALLMPIGYLIGMWSGVAGGFIFFFSVLGVDAVMYVLNFLNHKSVSDEINKKLKERRESDRDGEEE